MRVHTKLVYQWDEDQLILISEEGFEYSGTVAQCCGGASAAQNNLANAQANLAGSENQFYNETLQNYPQQYQESQLVFQESQQQYQQQAAFAKTLMSNYNTQFAEQQAIASTLTSVLTPIVAAGPSQYGFSPQETAVLMNQATANTTAQYEQAATALGQSQKQNESGIYVPSGAQQQLQEELQQSLAEQQSSQQLGITAAGYQQGLQNFNTAAQMLGGVGTNLTNPNAGSAISGLNSATSTAVGGLSGSTSALDQFTNSIIGAGSAAGQGYSQAFQSATTIQQMNNASSPLSILGGMLGGAVSNLNIGGGNGISLGG